MRKRILLVCPNSWDTVQLAARGRDLGAHYHLEPYGDDAEGDPASFDALGFVDQAVEAFRGRGLDGVASSSDYPGCLVAAAIAQELGLPGPRPEAVLRCSHKYYSRLAQRAVVPEATPAFALVDPRGSQPEVQRLRYPLFVKPVKSWFSQHARRVDTPEALAAFVASPEVQYHLSQFVTPFNQLVARYTDFEHDGSYLLAEELLNGVQVTVEGFVHQGRAQVVGIVDSVMYPGTISFQRFEYPSSLPEGVQRRMANIVERALPALGFDGGLFNVELFYDRKRDAVHIIEINPRMCGQFADLMEMVNGTNTYEILLALAAGDPPPPVRRAGGGRHRVAAAFALREFADRRVVRVPAAAAVEAVRAAHPVTFVKTLYREGQRLSDEDQSDGYSYRYALINMGGADWPSLLASFDAVRRRLGFEFAD